MAKFVKFKALGFEHKVDPDGGAHIVQVKGSGIVSNTDDKYGKIFRQCPDLMRCYVVSSVSFTPIG